MSNRIRGSSTSGGGAIHIFFDASRTGYDTTNSSVTNNTITLRGSATITVSVTCAHQTDWSPYWMTKGNLFQGNTYRVSIRTGETEPSYEGGASAVPTSTKVYTT